MRIYPAIDIQHGHAVRLRQGRKEDFTVFADSPLDAARHWRDLGASWLHVVDLDGAFSGSLANAPVIGRIVTELGLPVQAGGGIRTEQSARQYLDAGVTRLIIGTMALEDPDAFRNICAAFPGRIGVSLDADHGTLKTRGWLKDSGAKVNDILPELEKSGAAFIIYTDISRDGMHLGINIPALENILESTSLPVIAAGGVSTLEDIAQVYELRSRGNLDGVISGRALYEKTLDLPEALAWLAERQN